MFFKLLFLFIVLPIVEIGLLLEVGDQIGGWETLAIVILTAIFGAHLVKEQGNSALAEIKAQSATGQLPAQSITEGLMILVAGVLLVTPGFITDAFGLLLTIPFTRKPLAKILMQNFSGRVVTSGGFSGGFHHQQPNHTNHTREEQQVNVERQQGGNVIEGEWQRKD
ncbi:FxsA family protein [Catenovulum maritimum]|uniref:Biotin--acetyl-CoA-carboxylase ligase n=1 Tax=Catenovulum maritimum TaxID=1513271 RepID=A0A0J8GSX6_9ALTE|nr:FxsA family protein [Catenovulum maritimum]KMT63808.1 hypothetical protein XM47_17825 [Catenovulum maritimum]